MIYRKQWAIPLCWSVLCNPKDGTSVCYGSEWALKSKRSCGVIHGVLKQDDFKWGFSKFKCKMQRNIFFLSTNTAWECVKYSLFYISFKALNQPETVCEFVSAFPPVGKCAASLTSWPNNKDLGKTFVYRQADDARHKYRLGNIFSVFLSETWR